MRTPRILAFDLDGTLAESKSHLSADMAAALATLSHNYLLAIISGGDYSQYQECILPYLNGSANLDNVYLLPTSGGKIYRHIGGAWEQVFIAALTDEQKQHIQEVVEQSGVLILYPDEEIYGDVMEDRLTQFTLSMLGQRAPAEVKKVWDPDKAKRKRIVDTLAPLLPHFDVRYGGSTSIEIANKGIDKAFGIRKLLELTGYTKQDVLFFGDSIEEGGNDYSVRLMDVECIEVTGPEDTISKLQPYL